MKPSIIPADLTGKFLFDFLVKNERLIEHAKKSAIKKADEANYVQLFVNDKGQIVSKAEVQETQVDPTKLKVVLVINTTNWLDSHGDVHIPGLWKKSLADNKRTGFYLLNSHQKTFQDVIGEGLTGQTKNISWKDLGLDMVGTSEALVFSGIISEDRNPYMFGEYQKGHVKKHSVGMRYVKMVTCINDEDYPVQKENWDKYFPMVANADEAEADGYFWAILEAQVVEGSAVLFASNTVTPAMEVTILGTKTEPAPTTQNQPPSENNKSIIGCPACDYLFVADSDTAATNCPNCGQYVSPQSTTIMLSEPSFDLKKAIEQKTFINI
jgi:hypothetical protein